MERHTWRENLSLIVDIGTVLSWVGQFIFIGYSFVFKNDIGFLGHFNDGNFGQLGKSDAIFLTGLLLFSAITVSTYWSVRKWKIQHNGLWIITSVVFDLFSLWFYFRYWIGEDWWIFTCVIPIILLIIIILLSFSPKNLIDPLNTDSKDRNEKSSQKNEDTRGSFSTRPTRSDLSSYQLSGIQHLLDDCKELPRSVFNDLEFLTNILIKENLLTKGVDTYRLKGFIDKIKKKGSITYMDVMTEYGQTIADKWSVEKLIWGRPR